MPRNCAAVLITGASAGLGCHLAIAFAGHGHGLLIQGRNASRLQALKHQLRQEYQIPCSSLVADLATPQGIAEVASCLDQPNVGILVNNAAVNPELSSSQSVTGYSPLDEIMRVNATAAIALAHAAHIRFQARGGGMIVNISSVAGLRGSAHEPLYAASKFALRGFSESVKEDWLKRGTRIFDVYCGALAAGMSAHRADVQDLIDPQELSEYIVGLCSTRSFFAKEVNIRRTRV